MSDNTGSAAAGWFHAEGDPPGTHRYWNGSAWEGDPVPVAPTQPVAPAAPAPPAFSPPPTFGSPGAGAPGGPAHQPAFGGPALPEPEKKSNWWKWLLGVGLFLVLGIGGCSYALFRAVSGPIDVGNEYLAALQDRDFEQAWALSDPSCFAEAGPDALAVALGEFQIEGYRLSGANVSSNNGITTGTTSGTVTLPGNDVRSVEIFATKPGGEWSVCGIDIDGLG